jgi:hypothetical protein
MVQRDGVARQCNCASNKGRISVKQIYAGKKQPGKKPQQPLRFGAIVLKSTPVRIACISRGTRPRSCRRVCFMRYARSWRCLSTSAMGGDNQTQAVQQTIR